MKISPPSSQRDCFPLRRSTRRDFLPFSLALCGSKPSSQRSPRDDFPLRRSIRRDFLPFSLALCALCGSKPSSQRSQRDDFPLRHSIREDFFHSLWLSVLSVARNRVHRGRRETIFLSNAAYAGISFHSLWLSVLSVAQNRVHRETIFLSDAAYAGISFHLLLSVAQILIPLVINTTQGEDPIFRQPENYFGGGLLQSLRFFAMTFCKL